MRFITSVFKSPILLVCLLTLPLVGGCAPRGKASVNVHGVNYTDTGFRYTVTDPEDKDNSGGGELVGAYSAGGIMCCYNLPRHWRPGIKVLVQTSHRSEPKKGKPYGDLIDQQALLEVPPYANGKPGDLWVIRQADGTVAVIASDYQPDHEKWPGPHKGWPVPSIEFHRKLWDQEIEIAEDDVRTANELIKGDEENLEKSAREAWEVHSKYKSRDEVMKFSGPNDPNYHVYLKKRHKEYLERSEARLKRLKEERP